MKKDQFIKMYRDAFGNYELPLAFYYSKEPVSPPIKSRGCYMKDLNRCRKGETISYDKDSIGCPGGKVYSGFSEVPPFIPDFVSYKERYKQQPEQVTQFIKALEMLDLSDQYLNFLPLSKVDNLDQIEGLIFFVTPDVLCGLSSWIFFDRNESDTISFPFGSGCSSIISQTVVENKKNGYRSFLGLLDPSVRPHFESNLLSLAIPMSRFKVILEHMDQSCIQGTPSWKKIKQRIEDEI